MNGKAKGVLAGWLIVALLPLAAGAAVENEREPMPQGDPARSRMGQTMEYHPSLEKANELIGAKVLNEKQERLGTIEDIVLTPDRTAVSYAALSRGGLWGFGGKLFAVPWSLFEVRTGDNILILKNVNPEHLERAKGFDKGHWPTTASENWLGRDTAPAGSEPAAEAPENEPMTGRERAEGERMLPRSDRPAAPGVAEPTAAKAEIKHRKLSELTGLTIKNNEGEELGELENIVIDVHEGKVAYAVLSMRSGFLNLNKELVAIPWSSFEILPRLGTARLNADKETLQAIAFDEKEFPNLEDLQYSRQLHERFGARPYWEALGFVPGEERERPRDVSPWKEGSEYNSLYNPDNVKTIHGTIESVGTFRPEGASVEALRLRVKTDDGDTVTVHAGPRPYAESKKIAFHYGDEVTITGSPAELGWRNVFVASQIKKGDKTLELRTKEGKPAWNLDELKGSR